MIRQEEFITQLLAAATESGIAEAEVYFSQTESMRTLVRKGEIEEYGVHKAGGLSLRGLVDGKMGMAYTEALDKDAIVMLVHGVLESATLISDLDEQFIFGGSPSYERVDTLGDRGTPQERIDLALALDETARSLDSRVQELGHMGVQSMRETVRIVNTHGLDLSHEADYCYAIVQAIARQGERVSTGMGFGIAASLASLDSQAIAREAVQEAVFQLDAKPCQSGVMPVIFHNTAMADLMEAFTGVFSAEAAQKGLSLLAGKEGEQVASPCVTLIDDPLRPGALNTRAFDAEGVAAYTKNVIENGILKTLLYNLKTAKKAGVASTGNAARSGYSGAVGIAPSNLFIKEGSQSLAQLEEAMGSGLVVTGVEGLHAGVNAVSGDFSLLARGYLVEAGKAGRAVEQVTVAGNLFEILKDVVAVGNDTRNPIGSVSSPSVWIKGLAVAGE